METGLQGLNHEQKLRLWSERIAACRSSGQTVSSWCTENNVSTASYYKWQKRIYQMVSANVPQFVELPRPTKPSVVAVLHMGGAEVELREGIDEETLAAICRCLGSC